MQGLRRAACLALLVYVTLDFSVSDIPGAFMFDPSLCVEVVRTGGGEDPGSESMPRPLDALIPTSITPVVVDDNPRPPRRTEPPRMSRVPTLPRAALAAASPSEDPH
jgi:hypothetical protein